MIEEKIETQFPWVIFNLANSAYAITCKYISSINILSSIVVVPESPPYIRGVMNLRGKTISLIDLRKFLEMKSIPEEVEEFDHILEMRKQDHINWIKELENSINEDKEFKLTTDPHACAFGKWFDKLETEDIVMRSVLGKVDRVHKSIHAVGTKIKEFRDTEKIDEAKTALNETRNKELNQLIEYFGDFVKAYEESKKEIVIVLEKKDKTFGIIVDQVFAIEKITNNKLDEASNSKDNFLYITLRNNNTPVILIDEDHFLKVV